ncbi:hypothetical protein Tco_0500355 [Tanacetum coccineum]
MVERESDGRRPSERRVEDGESRRGNLPPLLAAHLRRNENGQPLQSTLTSEYGGNQPSANSGGISLLMAVFPSSGPPLITLIGDAPNRLMSNYGPNNNKSMYPTNVPPTSYLFYAQPINALPNAPMYPNYGPIGLFADSAGCITPFVRWIENYPLPDGLKMPSHQRDGKSTRAFATQYTDDTLQILRLHEEQCISGFVHGLKTISLVEFLSTDLPTTYKGLMEKTYTFIEAKEVATNRALSDHKEGFDRLNKGFSWDNKKVKKKNQDRFSPYKGSNHGLLTNLSKSPREILATKKVAKAFGHPPRMVGSRGSRDMYKYCHFHEDHGHKTN